MKKIIQLVLITTLCIPTVLTAQWTDLGTDMKTNDNVNIGATSNIHSLYVRKDNVKWQGRFANRDGAGSDVYLAHGSGHGMHIRGWTTGAQYTLQLYNKTAETNIFYNNGNVGLGLVGNVGIGTKTPSYKLHVASGGGSTIGLGVDGRIKSNSSAGGMWLSNLNDGFIGNNNSKNTIGFWTVGNGWSLQVNKTTGHVAIGGEPLQDHRLSVIGSIYGSDGLSLRADDGNQLRFIRGNYGLIQRFDGNDFWILSTASGAQEGTWSALRPFKVNAASGDVRMGDDKLVVKHGTGVGINTDAIPAGYVLAIDGKMIVEECKVKPSQWWDEAFEEDYELMSIEDKENYTKENHHLPAVDSETEVMKEGVNMGEFSGDLLKEVEEAYLYIFQLNDLIKNQQQQIEELSKNLNVLNDKAIEK